MSWELHLEYAGFSFGVMADCYAEWSSKPESSSRVFFFLKDAEVKEAIAQGDPRILEVLQYVVDHQEEIEAVGGADDSFIWECVTRQGPDELERRCQIILNSALANQRACDQATKHLAIAQELKRKRAQREAKRRHVAHRRTVFSAERDRLMLALIERDGYHCQECGSIENITIDHIVPLSRGGSDELNNLRLLCRSCNSRKGDRP